MSQLPILQKEILAKKCAPIKIMQFGEGNFLRAFVDWLVQKMNDSGEYDGHVVVVQPLENGRVAALAEQDGLYTLILQGLDENGVAQRPHKVIDVLDDFVNPYAQYEKYLSYAESKDLEVVISNTTEAGIAFDPEDVKRDFSKETPHSYPGKLYALLERRYEKLGKNYGLAIIPCELIDDNGDRLHEVLLELAKAKGASEGFIDFLDNSCHYTSTLVDRIVPGFPRDEFESLCEEFGYIDNNMVKGEYFHLYVLKNEPFVMQKFPVHKVGLHAIYVDDIHPYKARKVRILNGSHTALVPVAYLSGKNEVREALLDENIHGFLLNLINKETLPTISTADAPKFASDVMDRFLNPYVHHALMSIALNSTSKWKERDLPILLDDLKKGIVPHHLIFSFAALIAFYRGIRTVNGLREEIKLADNPEYLAEWQRIWTRFDREGGVQAIVDEILSKTDFWGINLLEVPSFPREELRDDLVLILQKGCYEALKEKFPVLDAVKIHPEDDVMVALHDLPAGTEVEGIVLLEDVKQAHKFAIHDMKKGELLHKYGNVIGRLKCDVKKGQWIHSDELGTALDEAPTYHYQKGKVTPKKESQRTWQGYLREDGRAGTRNDLFLIPTVGCVNLQLQTLREKFLELHPEMKGRVQIASHPYGCSQLGGDFENTAALLSGIAHNPNAGGVLVLGLGCENNRLSEFVKRLSDIPEKRLRYFNSQDHEDEIEHGLAMLEELYFNMKGDVRVTLPLSKLTLGLKCGGSDGFSGLTANPLLGLAADEIGACGGQVGLTEVPEMFGAEQDLMNRAKDEATYKKVVGLIENFKAYYARNNQPCYENPSPGNKDGGITTLEEKSNGCVLKGGHLEVEDVLDYGERFRSPGLSLLNGPGNDIVASTNLLAAGATIICFTTGRGTPFSSIVPTLKLATNHKLASFKSNWIDFDCQVVFEKGFEEAKEELLDLIVRVASGEKSKGEEHGMAQIALFKTGVTL